MGGMEGGLAKGAVCLEWSGVEGAAFQLHIFVRISSKGEQRQRLSEWGKKGSVSNATIANMNCMFSW